MNGIQNYLMSVVNDAIHQASGDLIKYADVDPVLVAKSMQELLEHLENCKSTLETSVDCQLKFVGFETRKLKAGDLNAKPVFM